METRESLEKTKKVEMQADRKTEKMDRLKQIVVKKLEDIFGIYGSDKKLARIDGDLKPKSTLTVYDVKTLDDQCIDWAEMYVDSYDELDAAIREGRMIYFIDVEDETLRAIKANLITGYAVDFGILRKIT